MVQTVYLPFSFYLKIIFSKIELLKQLYMFSVSLVNSFTKLDWIRPFVFLFNTNI